MELLQDLDHMLQFQAFEKMANELNKDQHILIVNPTLFTYIINIYYYYTIGIYNLYIFK